MLDEESKNLEIEVEETQTADNSQENLNLESEKIADNSTQERKSDTKVIRKKIPKPTPIHIVNINIKNITKSMIENEINKNAFTFKETDPKNHAIYIETHMNYIKVKEILKTNNYQSFTYTPKNEKHITLVLKVINSEYDEEQI